MIAWEVTRSCNLGCRHCRASSEFGPYTDELTTAECFRIIDEIASLGGPVIILTGGEPLLRKDIFTIAEYASGKSLRVVMATNGTLLTEESAGQIKRSGINRISISLDGPDEAAHDSLRQVSGSFAGALRGIKKAQEAGLKVQVNSTISKGNIRLIPALMRLAEDLKADALHFFLLVPTGRAKVMLQEELSPAEYEEALRFLSQRKKEFPLEMKVTCAPHFNRLLLEGPIDAAASLKGRGCMGGVSFCFISHTGQLQPCGYLEIKCGNFRDSGFRKIWLESEVFNNLRDFSQYRGKCGRCEFKAVCGGCRARAFAKNGDYLAEEPYCVYEPSLTEKK